MSASTLAVDPSGVDLFASRQQRRFMLHCGQAVSLTYCPTIAKCQEARAFLEARRVSEGRCTINFRLQVDMRRHFGRRFPSLTRRATFVNNPREADIC